MIFQKLSLLSFSYMSPFSINIIGSGSWIMELFSNVEGNIIVMNIDMSIAFAIWLLLINKCF